MQVTQAFGLGIAYWLSADIVECLPFSGLQRYFLLTSLDSASSIHTFLPAMF